jgi:hypothetical protein
MPVTLPESTDAPGGTARMLGAVSELEWRGALAAAVGRTVYGIAAGQRAGSGLSLGDVWWLGLLGVTLAAVTDDGAEAAAPALLPTEALTPPPQTEHLEAAEADTERIQVLPLLAQAAGSPGDGGTQQTTGSTPPPATGPVQSVNADPPQEPVDTDVKVPKPPARGSATSPELLGLSTTDIGAAGAVNVQPVIATLEALIGTPGNDVFVFVPEFGIASINGSGGLDTIDFSGLTNLAPVNRGDDKDDKDDDDDDQGRGGDDDENNDGDGDGDSAALQLTRLTDAPNGVYVDLSSNGITVTTSQGEVTVNAWQLDGNGLAAVPLAHLEGIDNVIGTVGNDILIGNANANTFTYTASNGDSGAVFGVDIYVGGAAGPADPGDTADFSRLGPSDGSAAGATALPDAAAGISVDLVVAVSVTVTDPLSGADTVVTGSLVTTSGSSDNRPLALLTWGTDDSGQTISTIEAIVASAGADEIRGDQSDNTITFTGGGSGGADIYDGRGGTDTADFSAVVLADAAGISITLSTEDVDVTITGSGETSGSVELIGSGTSIAVLESIENVIATAGNDVLEGSALDNVLTGGSGSDTFLFVDFVSNGDHVGLLIGHDTIQDFDVSGSGGQADRLALATFLLTGLGEQSTQEGRVEAFLTAYGLESEGGFSLVFDAGNSITLTAVTRTQLSNQALASDWSSPDGNFFYFC